MPAASTRRLRSLRGHLLPGAAPVAVHQEVEQQGFNVHGRPLQPAREDAPLSEDEIAAFMERGYVALPGVMQDDLRLRLCDDVDQLEADRADPETQVPFVVEYEELGKLCSFPAVVDKVEQLMRACKHMRHPRHSLITRDVAD